MTDVLVWSETVRVCVTGVTTAVSHASTADPHAALTAPGLNLVEINCNWDRIMTFDLISPSTEWTSH